MAARSIATPPGPMRTRGGAMKRSSARRAIVIAIGFGTAAVAVACGSGSSGGGGAGGGDLATVIFVHAKPGEGWAPIPVIRSAPDGHVLGSAMTDQRGVAQLPVNDGD